MTEFDVRDFSLELFLGHDFVVSKNITIHQPTLEEVFSIGEENFQKYIFTFTSTPSNYKFQLYDMGIRFDELPEWELFLFYTRQQIDNNTSEKIVKGFNFTDSEVYVNKENDEMVLVDTNTGVVFDRAMYTVVADYLRQMTLSAKKMDRAMTEPTLIALVEEDRQKAMSTKGKAFESSYVPIIMSATNCADFKYDYFTVRKLPIYVFLYSVRRVGKIIKYNNLMTGVYTGNIDIKSLKPEDWSWLED